MSCVTLFKRRDSTSEEGLEVLTSGQVADIDPKTLAGALANEAASDSRLRGDLQRWQAQVQLHIDGDVSNNITGEIHGKAVQELVHL
jgi:translation initiation factor 1 (eIF-1/SUI1)